MPKVEMRLYASLRKYSPQLRVGEALKLSLGKGTTLQQLYRKLNIPIGEVKIVLVNGRVQNHGYILSDGDRIAIFPAIAGGCARAK